MTTCNNKNNRVVSKILAVNLFLRLHLFFKLLDDSDMKWKLCTFFFLSLALTLSRWEISDEIKSWNKTSSWAIDAISWLKSQIIDREIGLKIKYFGNENRTFGIFTRESVNECFMIPEVFVAFDCLTRFTTRMWHVAISFKVKLKSVEYFSFQAFCEKFEMEIFRRNWVCWFVIDQKLTGFLKRFWG